MIDYPDNFTRDELLYSETAEKLDVENVVECRTHELNLLTLAHWLQRLRDKLGEEFEREVTIIVSSGYRCPKLNREVGGVDDSYHLLGLAADIKASGLTARELAQFIKRHFVDFEEVIDEYGRWVHVALPCYEREAIAKIKNKGYVKI